MRIFVSDLKDGVPVSVHEEYDPKELELELVDLKFLDKLILDGVVEKQFEAVSFNGKLTSRVRRICGRTLKEVDEPLSVDFDYYYPAKDADVIETIDDIREAVLMDQPMVYYAPGTEPAENDQDAKLEEDEESNPFRKLKDLRDRLKEE